MKTLARENYKQKKEWRRRKVKKNAANSPHEVLSTMPNGSTRTSLQPKFIYCGWAEHNYKMVQFKFYRHGICLPGSVVKKQFASHSQQTSILLFPWEWQFTGQWTWLEYRDNFQGQIQTWKKFFNLQEQHLWYLKFRQKWVICIS